MRPIYTKHGDRVDLSEYMVGYANHVNLRDMAMHGQEVKEQFARTAQRAIADYLPRGRLTQHERDYSVELRVELLCIPPDKFWEIVEAVAQDLVDRNVVVPREVK